MVNEDNLFEDSTIEDAKKIMQNMFNDITPEQFEELKKQALENVKKNNMSAKKILDELKDEDNYVEDYGFRYKRIALDDVWQLLDYITNLQEEKNMFKGSFETMSKNYFEEKTKNEKAIEYINRHINQNTFDGYLDTYEIKKLLNILQGEDKE